MKEIPKYPIYKGLQKPLIFKGFKGRYIYWGIGAILIDLILACIFCIFVDTFIGLCVMAVFLAISLFIIYKKQEKGLYNRKKDTDTLFIFKNNLK